MKPRHVKLILHLWGIAWVVGLSFCLLDASTASAVALLCLPVNYRVSNSIYKHVFESDDDTDDTDIGIGPNTPALS